MQVWWDPEKWRQDQLSLGSKPVALTLGNFDGVHKGHQKLLKNVVDAARSFNGQSLLLTFHPHPAQILAPEKKHVRLFTLRDQQQELEKYGLDGVLRQAFSREFSEISAPDFLEDYILKYFQPRYITVGHDFVFGAHRQGNFELLKAFCEKRKIRLELVPAFKVDGETVSTSNIRRHLLAGELRQAEALLGRRYYLQGVVEKGAARGRTLGFPTANIKPDVDFFPRMGVYICEVIRLGVDPDKRRLRAVMNVGLNRTFVEGDHQPIKAEVHLLDFSEDLYGQTLQVELCQYLREEKKFGSIDELKRQIQADVEAARKWVPA
jgi:riboflavin kinase/FMN adenylyltransferase